MVTTKIRKEYLYHGGTDYLDLFTEYFDEFITTGKSGEDWVEFKVSGQNVPVIEGQDTEVVVVVETGEALDWNKPNSVKMKYTVPNMEDQTPFPEEERVFYKEIDVLVSWI